MYHTQHVQLENSSCSNLNSLQFMGDVVQNVRICLSVCICVGGVLSVYVCGIWEA